jgi:hypothetical protein
MIRSVHNTHEKLLIRSKGFFCLKGGGPLKKFKLGGNVGELKA